MEKFNKKDLAKLVSDKFDVTSKVATEVVDTVFGEIIDQVKKDTVVDISGFGKFVAKHKPARDGINPRTKETVHIAAKNVPAFKPAKAFKEAL